MSRKIGMHYLGRGVNQSMVDAGMRISKFVNNPPPVNRPANFTTVFRWVESPDNLNDKYNQSPELWAANWIEKQAEHFLDVPLSVYTEGVNEPDCESVSQAQWLNRFELERMKRMEAMGRKCCIFNFGTGRPPLPVHDPNGSEIWTELLPALRYAKSHGHIMGMHGYSQDIDEWSMLRYRRVYNWLPADARPKLFIGEWGLDGKINGQPARFRDSVWRSQFTDPDAAYMDLIRRYDAELMKDDYVLGFALYTLGNGANPNWQPFNIEGYPVEAMILDYLKTASDNPPIDDEPPEEPPMPDITNTIANPSFEGSTYTRSDNRSSLFPEGWQAWWADRNVPRLNPDAPQGQGRQDQDWDAPEVLPRTAAFVADIPVKDGLAMLKAFKGQAPTWVKFYQSVELEPGEYRLGLWVFPDQVTAYTSQGKVYQKEGNSPDWYLASEVRIGIAGQLPDFVDARNVKIGVWNWLETTFTLAEKKVVTITIECRGRWGFANNGWWLDGVKLTQVEVIPDPDPVPVVDWAELTRLITQLQSDLDSLKSWVNDNQS